MHDSQLTELSYGALFYLMKKSVKKFVTTIPCRFGWHKPNWYMMCTSCKRPLESGIFYEPRSLGHRNHKPNAIEILPEEVLSGKFIHEKAIPRKTKFDRNQKIVDLFEEWGNKARIARIFGISATAVAKVLEKNGQKVVNSFVIDAEKKSGTVEM